MLNHRDLTCPTQARPISPQEICGVDVKDSNTYIINCLSEFGQFPSRKFRKM